MDKKMMYTFFLALGVILALAVVLPYNETNSGLTGNVVGSTSSGATDATAQPFFPVLLVLAVCGVIFGAFVGFIYQEEM